jgi:hypothetical protein
MKCELGYEIEYEKPYEERLCSRCGVSACEENRDYRCKHCKEEEGWYEDECEYCEFNKDREDNREAVTTCDGCEKNLYGGDDYWGNNQFGTFCEECAEKEIASWWGVI